MNAAAGSQKKRFFRPVSFFIIWGFLAFLLILNGIYEGKRTKDNLYRLLADEAAALSDGITGSAQNSLAYLAALETLPEAVFFAGYSPGTLLALEESVIDGLLELAFRIDEKLGGEIPGANRLAEAQEEEKIAGLEIFFRETLLSRHRKPPPPLQIHPPFYQGLLEGKAAYALQRSEKKTTGLMDYLSVAVLRRAGPGILILHADPEDIYRLRRRIVLQGAIEEWTGKGDLLYARFQGKDGEVWAGFDLRENAAKGEAPKISPGRGGERKQAEPPPGGPGKGVLEKVRAVSLDPKSEGFLFVGLSREKVDRIISGDLRNLVLFGFFLLLFAGAGIVFVYRLETRHLAGLGEMEEKVRRSEKLSSLANLAAGVAHEIRNPLNAIGMAIQRLQREFPQETPELQKEYFHFTDVLRGEVKRVNDIIEQFLFFARPARLNRQRLQVDDLFADLALLLKEPAERAGISFEKETEAALPAVRGDRQRLQEALWNLIQNGLQAMPAGGTLRLRAGRRNPGAVRIEIADTGEGIPEENLARIFDYYFTTREKGTGLGLPLAHKIIQEHGGSVAVRSRRGKGTTFDILLPVFEEEK